MARSGTPAESAATRRVSRSSGFASYSGNTARANSRQRVVASADRAPPSRQGCPDRTAPGACRACPMGRPVPRSGAAGSAPPGTSRGSDARVWNDSRSRWWAVVRHHQDRLFVGGRPDQFGEGAGKGRWLLSRGSPEPVAPFRDVGRKRGVDRRRRGGDSGGVEQSAPRHADQARSMATTRSASTPRTRSDGASFERHASHELLDQAGLARSRRRPGRRPRRSGSPAYRPAPGSGEGASASSRPNSGRRRVSATRAASLSGAGPRRSFRMRSARAAERGSGSTSRRDSSASANRREPSPAPRCDCPRAPARGAGRRPPARRSGRAPPRAPRVPSRRRCPPLASAWSAARASADTPRRSHCPRSATSQSSNSDSPGTPKPSRGARRPARPACLHSRGVSCRANSVRSIVTGRIQPDGRRIGLECGLPDRPADHTERLVQGVTRRRLGLVAPEEADQVFPSAGLPRGERQVHQEREVLLPEQFGRRRGAVHREVDGAEQSRRNHRQLAEHRVGRGAARRGRRRRRARALARG